MLWLFHDRPAVSHYLQSKKINISFAEVIVLFLTSRSNIYICRVHCLYVVSMFTLHANFWNHNVYPWNIRNPRIQIRKFKLAQKWFACSTEISSEYPRISTAVENKYPRTSIECTPFHVDYFPANLTRATRLPDIFRVSRVGRKTKFPEMLLRIDRRESSGIIPLGFSETYLFIRRGGRAFDVRQRRRSGHAGTIRGDRLGTFPKSFLGPVTSYDQRQDSQHQRTET